MQLVCVWTDMLADDGPIAAEEAASSFPSASGIAHFHDPKRLVGQCVAELLGASGTVAWDFYLLYRPSAEWKDVAPAPASWFHQLGDEAWASQEHFRWGSDLAGALGPAMQAALGEDPYPTSP